MKERARGRERERKKVCVCGCLCPSTHHANRPPPSPAQDTVNTNLRDFGCKLKTGRGKNKCKERHTSNKKKKGNPQRKQNTFSGTSSSLESEELMVLIKCFPGETFLLGPVSLRGVCGEGNCMWIPGWVVTKGETSGRSNYV